MKCIYCDNEMTRTNNSTMYGVFIGYKCPACDFAFSHPADHPDDVTIYFPDEEKLKSIKAAI